MQLLQAISPGNGLVAVLCHIDPQAALHTHLVYVATGNYA